MEKNLKKNGASGKEPACQCRRHKRHGSIAGLGKSPGGEHGIPLQYSYLENPTDRGTWWATVHRVAELDTTEATLAQQSLCCIPEFNTTLSINYTSVK